MKFTPEQETVISADPGQILVTAAAGSGKTTVLTERIIRRLGRRELDLRRVLVLTFTDAAAVSMRDKIESALLEARKRAVGEDLGWFNTQLAVLRQTSVSTIHSFCFKLIRRYAHCLTDAEGNPLLPLNPRVIQPLTGELIWTESVNATLKSAYAATEDSREEDCDFYQLLDTYSGSRNDEPLRALMTDLHLRLRSLPDYREHCRRNLSDLEESLENPGSGREYKFFLDIFINILTKAESDLLQVEELLNSGPPCFYPYNIRPATKQDRDNEEKDVLLCEDIKACLHRLRSLSGLCASGSEQKSPIEYFDLWNELYKFGQEFLTFWSDSALASLRRSSGKPEATQRRNELTRLLKESTPADIIYMLTGQCSTRYRDAGRDPRIQPVFLRSAEEVQADIKLMLPALRELFRLTLAADETAIQTRQERGEIDFSDFEHYALQLLRQPEIRAEFVRAYDEIYIDEYQDTSGIQEAILTATGIERIFRVGDIKQSIYRFRQARPSLFLDKLLGWSKGDQKPDGRVYYLNTNFRSRAGILAGINDIFLRLMTEEIAGIDYSDGHALMPFRADNPDNLLNTRLILVTEEGKEDTPRPSGGFNDETEEPDNENDDTEAMATPILSDSKLLNLEKRNKQIYITAREILRLVREENVSFNDCAILVSTNEMLRSVSRFLQELHIPVSGKLEFDFRATWELRLMRSLISLLANQMQDIPLATAMLAPLYEGGFSEGDLLLFRQVYDDERPFYHAITDLAALTPEMIEEKWPNRTAEAENLLSKLQGFMAWLDECRDMCETRRIHEVLSYIFESRGFYRRLELSDGSVTIFKEIAEGLDFLAQIEREGNYGIIAVDEYLSNHENLPGSIRMAIESGSAEEAVKVMTYHGSKGLEFPYVFLLQLDAGFRANQGSGRVIYNQDLQPGFDCRYPNGYTEWPSLHKLMVQAEEAAADLAERLRVLYVAMTRAEERLYLVGQLSRKSKEDSFAEVERLGETQSPRSLQDFILSALFEHRGLNLREWLNEPDVARSNKTSILVPASSLKGDLRNIAELYCPENEVSAVDPDWNSTWVISLYALPESLPYSELLSKESGSTPEEYVAERLSDNASELAANTEDSIGYLRTDPLHMPSPQTYPYLAGTQQALKLSISEIKRNADLSEALSEESPYSIDSLLHLYAPVSLEIEDLFIPEESATGREQALRRGVIIHTLLEHIDIAEARKSGLASVNNLIDTLLRHKLLTPDELILAEGCAESVLNFVNSDLAATIIAADSFWREMPFTLALPNDHLYYLTKNPNAVPVSADGHDKTLVQGIIDLWYIDRGEAVIVDFKSDRLPDDHTAAELKLKERYLIQGQIYAWAVAAATGLPVRKFVIYSLSRNQAFEYPVLPIKDLPD